MPKQKESITLGDLSEDGIVKESLLNDYNQFRDVLDIPHLMDTLPAKILSSGTKTSSDPIYGNQRVVVNPGENIQQAVNLVHEAGGGIVELKQGTHVVNYDIILYSNITLKGVGDQNTTINFNGNANQIRTSGSSVYSAGTLSVNNGSTAVTGLGTLWLANVTTASSILINGIFYPIAAVLSDTSITLALPFADTNVAGVTYVAAVTESRAIINGITVTNSIHPNGAIYANNISETLIGQTKITASLVAIKIENVASAQFNEIDVVGCYSGVVLNNAWYSLMYASGFIDILTGDAVNISNSNNCSIHSSYIVDAALDGIKLTTCENIAITDSAVLNCNIGIECVSGNNNISIKATGAENCTSDGIKFTATTDNSWIIGSALTNNGGYGVNIAASTCDNNIVCLNNFTSNSSGAINDLGTNTQICTNVGAPLNKVRAVSTTQSLLANDYIVLASGTITLTLPTAVGISGKIYFIKNTSTGTITVNTTSSQTIDGNLTEELNQYDCMQIVSDNANWHII